MVSNPNNKLTLYVLHDVPSLSKCTGAFELLRAVIVLTIITLSAQSDESVCLSPFISSPIGCTCLCQNSIVSYVLLYMYPSKMQAQSR